MNASKILCVSVLLLQIVVIVIPTQAQTTSPQQTLRQYVADLQKNPNDYALRERIIQLVKTMRPAPAIPEEARRHYVVGKTLSDGAKKPEDFNDAITEFKSALLAAPWWPEANRDFALTLEAAERFDEAIAYVKLYMATNPGDERMRAAQDELYKIEARQKLAAKAARESTPPPVVQERRDPFEDLLRKIDGRRYTRLNNPGCEATLDVRGKVLVHGLIGAPGNSSCPGYQELGRIEIQGRETQVPVPAPPIALRVRAVSQTFIVSEDGVRITQRVRFSDGDVREYIHLWQR